MIFTCAGCGQQFKSYEHDAKVCSIPCFSAMRRKVDGDKLKQLSFAGASVWEMAAEFGVHRQVIRKWLKRDGLYESWKEQRYA
jgi:hypothetical protein